MSVKTKILITILWLVFAFVLFPAFYVVLQAQGYLSWRHMQSLLGLTQIITFVYVLKIWFWDFIERQDFFRKNFHSGPEAFADKESEEELDPIWERAHETTFPEVYWNGQKGYEGELRDGKSEGIWHYWYESGQLFQEIHWKNGLQHGPTRSWYTNGIMASESFWQDGLENGPLRLWHLNGNMKANGQYHYSEKNGLWIWYEWDGTEVSRETYNDEGVAEEWHFFRWWIRKESDWDLADLLTCIAVCSIIGYSVFHVYSWCTKNI
jgi:hypothetical protein